MSKIDEIFDTLDKQYGYWAKTDTTYMRDNLREAKRKLYEIIDKEIIGDVEYHVDTSFGVETRVITGPINERNLFRGDQRKTLNELWGGYE